MKLIRCDFCKKEAKDGLQITVRLSYKRELYIDVCSECQEARPWIKEFRANSYCVPDLEQRVVELIEEAFNEREL